MELIQLIVLLIVIGVLLGLVNHYGPTFHLDSKFLAIINAVVVIAVVLWLLAVFGLLPALRIRVPPS